MEDCICKDQSQDDIFQQSEHLHFENVFSGPTKVGPTINSGYGIMSNTLSVNSASKVSNVVLL